MQSSKQTQKEIINMAIEQIASIFVALIDHKEKLKRLTKQNDEESEKCSKQE
jgi:hypothetical protein